MQKRGQVYIAAVILCIVLYGVSTQVNKIDEEMLVKDFNELSTNYAKEAPRLINLKLSQGSMGVETELKAFTNDYLAYAKTRDPNLGLVYVYGAEDKTVIENFLPMQSGAITWYGSGGQTGNILSSKETVLNTVNVDIAGTTFTHVVPVEVKQFSEELTTANIPEQASNIRLNIAGVFYEFNNVENENPKLYMIVQSRPTSQITQQCITGPSGVDCPT